MEIEGKGEKQQQQQGQGQNENKGKRTIIEIPSYEQVVQNSQPKSTPLFTSTPSFSQAFSFIKNSEFYTPPPQPPPSTSSQEIRHSDRLEAPTSSASSAQVHASSSSLNSVQTRNSVLVSHRQWRSIQKGNPLLKHIRNVRWNFADIVCDYLLGQSTCALYLSLRYHLLHPDYLYYRIRELQKNYKLRIVLCHVDVEDVAKPLLEVTRTAMLHDCTLLCGWSLEECGRYLETIKVYENKPADLIQGQMDTDYISRLSHCLTAIRHVNKTDVVTLGSTFGSLSHIMDASMEDLAHCPGIGERKVKRLYDTFHEPFKRVVPSRPPATESSVQNCAKSPVDDEVPEVVKEEGNTSKRTKKEPEMTVTSALSAAFARYSSKIGKKNDKSLGEKNEGSIADEEENAERI